MNLGDRPRFPNSWLLGAGIPALQMPLMWVPHLNLAGRLQDSNLNSKAPCEFAMRDVGTASPSRRLIAGHSERLSSGVFETLANYAYGKM